MIFLTKTWALFAPKSVTKSENNEHKKFIYEQEILDFIKSYTGVKIVIMEIILILNIIQKLM